MVKFIVKRSHLDIQVQQYATVPLDIAKAADINSKPKLSECAKSIIAAKPLEVGAITFTSDTLKREFKRQWLTTCCAERAFSSLKTYLRSTMTQKRLNSMAVLNCHHTYLDAIDIDKISDEFISIIPL